MTFDPDPYQARAVGLAMEVTGRDDVPMHQHTRGQLLTTSWGTVSCETADGLWPISSNNALWIPGGQMHRSTVSSGAQIVIIYFAAQTVQLPSAACFLTLTPLVREMMLHLARLGGDYAAETRHSRIANLLIEELSEAVVDRLYVAMPADPRLRRVAYIMLEEPGDRRTLSEWADVASMSERSLRRQIERETGMTFGRWRQQVQLAVALRELRSGVPIKIVADKLGYESIAAFSTMFKKHLGRPPGRYVSTSPESGQ
jgi:AraC-like DNA-binding protein